MTYIPDAPFTLVSGPQLYTRAYELFKRFNAAPQHQGTSQSGGQGPGRLTLWIAYLIAHTYYEAGKFDMAVRYMHLASLLIVKSP